ncbi:MAG: DUF4292 domain-containing protein [Flavobacteriaceae bacterium]|nr:DUF4292 domain-containing protein [Flavobacteriaceae bacterium]
MGKNSILHLGYILLMFVAFGACKSAKTAKIKTVYLPPKEIVTRHYTDENKPLKFTSKMVIKYKKDQDELTLEASCRMIKDTAIWISISKLGFQVGKLYITPKKVQFYEVINKSYFDGDFQLISDLTGIEFNYHMFQNLLLGNALIDLREERLELSVEEHNYLLVPKNKNHNFEAMFRIDPVHFKMNQETLILDSEKSLDIVYKNYRNKQDVWLPGSLILQTRKNNKNISLEVDIKEAEFVGHLNFPFKMPEGYKQIKLQ